MRKKVRQLKIEMNSEPTSDSLGGLRLTLFILPAAAWALARLSPADFARGMRFYARLAEQGHMTLHPAT